MAHNFDNYEVLDVGDVENMDFGEEVFEEVGEVAWEMDLTAGTASGNEIFDHPPLLFLLHLPQPPPLFLLLPPPYDLLSWSHWCQAARPPPPPSRPCRGAKGAAKELRHQQEQWL